jgi:starch synthase
LASKNNKLKICLVTAELAPFAKTGGLADVSGALSAYLHDEGHDVRVLMPLYSTLKSEGLVIQPVPGLQNLTVDIGPWEVEYSIDCATLDNGMPLFLLRCPALYQRDSLYTQNDDEHLRFTLLARAAFEMCQRMQFAPDIMHCHDWHAGLVPLYLRTVYAWDKLFSNTKSALTIHNIGYQGVFSADIIGDLNLPGYEHMLHQDDLNSGRINFLKTGLLYADLLTTVSPTYAREIQGAEYGMGLDDILRKRDDALIGILNGVDDHEWNPETDPLIPKNFSARDLSGKKVCKKALQKELGLNGTAAQPLLGIVSRLVGQKGLDLLEGVLPKMLQQRDFSLAVLGTGEVHYERFFHWLHKRAPGQVSFYRGYSNTLAHWIEAGSDMFLMPSRYEPCGLNQMYSLKYGTVPIVRETGGLADSVQPINPADGSGTGILFRHYDETGLEWAVNTALNLYEDKALWTRVMRNGMALDFSWQQQGAQYVTIFRSLAGK